MRYILITVLLSMTTVGSGIPDKHKPTSTPKQGATGQQSGPDAQQPSHAQNGQEPTQNVTVIENQSDAPEQKGGAQQESQDIKIQRRMLNVTWILAGASVLQFLILVFTFWVMRDTARRQLRAYVCVSKALLKLEPPDSPEAQVYFSNGGQTPAYNVRQWIHIWIEKWPLEVELPTPSEDFQIATSILPAASENKMLLQKKPPVSPQSVHLLGTKIGTVYVYGEIRYRDAFGKERYTKYRLMYGGADGGRKGLDAKGVPIGYLQPEIEGNEAN